MADQEDICLPVYVRCNDVYDCPGHEDEADCDTYTCPGFYRCRASRVCVHRDHVCDGNYHCPQRDDELFCQLDCPDNFLREFRLSMLSTLVNLQTLNLSESGIEHVLGEGQQMPRKLSVLDVRGCPLLTFPRNMLNGTVSLQAVFSDNYKLCCPASLPADFNLNNCQAPSDEISSCRSLLRADVYRVFLSVFAILSLTGNTGTFVFRSFAKSSNSKSGFSVFVSHLCLADLFMGVYLAMIGVADRLYQGTYLWEDVQWRNSVACKVAGFLSLLSSEASAFIICLITADRFVVTRFPFSSGYASGVMIVLNFLLFLLIAVGQGAVYASIRGSSMGLLGLLASQDVPVSGELNVGMAILVLPLNAALNPFLYTLNILLERRRKAREERMLKQLLLHWEQDTDIHKP
nr:hypothetical protein BaRGS_018916 [Batillaria attramentaria]